MPSITNAERDALIQLRNAARDAWESARLLKATQGRSIVRTDMSMQRLYEAMIAAERVTFKASTRSKAKRS